MGVNWFPPIQGCIIVTTYLLDGILTLSSDNTNSSWSEVPYNAEESVIENIMTRINSITRHSRPVARINDTVDVRMSVSLNHILDFDEKNQVLTTMIWKSMNWQDKRLSWDPATYEGLQKITLSPRLIWTPDIVLYNSMDMKMAEIDRYRLILTHNGMIEWIPAIVHKSVCHVDMENFPYDTQHCAMKFGSWAHSEQQVNLETNKNWYKSQGQGALLMNCNCYTYSPKRSEEDSNCTFQMTLDPHTDGLDLSTYTSSMEWDLLEASPIRNAQRYECCPEVYVDITYTFVLVRKSAFYTQFLIIPIVLLSGMVFTIFWIPPTRPDRTGLGMSLFASFMLLLLLVVQISPPSKSIKLVTYCCFNIVMIATATLLSTIVVNISHVKRPPPQCFKRISALLASFNNRKSSKRSSSDQCISLENNGKDENKTTKSSKMTKTHLEQWQAFAFILDRTFFVVFFVCSLVLMVLYLPKPI